MVKSEGRKLITIRELEGVHSAHDFSMNNTLTARKGPLEGFKDVAGMAAYIGGSVVDLGLGETWTVKKEFFPGVEVYIVYNEADEELPSSLKILYGGERIREMAGEDMAAATIFCFNHMVRYVRTPQGKHDQKT